MKYYYIAKDFLTSRHGKILSLAFAMVIGAVFVGSHLKNQKEETVITPASQSNVWEDDNGELNDPIQQAQRNKSFEAFTPIAPKTEKVVIQPKPQAKHPPVIQAPKVVKQVAPLFKEQRKASKVAIATKSPTLPKLEPGALIHCRLLTPATTDHANLPVIAQITRPVIRDGITLIPRGTKITGIVKTSKNKRIFFAPNWQVYTGRNRSLNLAAHVQESSYNPHTKRYNLADGRAGLPGFIENEQKVKRVKILGEVVKGIARLGKETVRTTAGEYIPSTGRNAAINISSTVVDGLLPKSKQQLVKQEPYIHVPAGREFYLMITSTNQAQGSPPSQETSIDQLWAEAIRKRLTGKQPALPQYNHQN